jgi:hypothetical protein
MEPMRSRMERGDGLKSRVSWKATERATKKAV